MKRKIISFLEQLNLMTYHKIMLYLLILILIFCPYANAYIFIIGLLGFFINSRLSDLLKANALFNSVMYLYLNFHQDNKTPYSLKTFPSNEIAVDIRKNVSELIKLTIYDNELVRFIHKLNVSYQ